MSSLSVNNESGTKIGDLPPNQNNAEFPVNAAQNGNNLGTELNNNNNNNTLSLDQTTINQIVGGIKDAERDGSTRLQSRDMPQDTTQFTQDVQIKPNFIPTHNNSNDYISEDQERNNTTQNNSLNSNSIFGERGRDVYAEIQTPLLLSILFFIFQMPFFKNKIMEMMPFLFISDGNYSVNGYISISILFGVLYYSINTILVNIIPTVEK
jgi:hypothetical protein